MLCKLRQLPSLRDLQCFLDSPCLSKHRGFMSGKTELWYHGSQNLGKLAFLVYSLASVDYISPPNILTEVPQFTSKPEPAHSL